MSLEAIAPQTQRTTLHRTSCCRSLVDLLLRVHNLQATGHIFSPMEVKTLLEDKSDRLLYIREICHSCTVAFTNLPMSSSSSLSSLSLSAEELTPTLEYNFGEL